MSCIERAPEYTNIPDQFNIARKMARYVIDSSVEFENPDIVFKAQQIHGACYVASNYVAQEALDENGIIFPELDSTRGDGGNKVIVTYLLAREMGKSIDEAGASVRLIDVTKNGNITNLPTCKYFKDSTTNIVERIDEATHSFDGAINVREIAALSTVNFSDSLGSYEIMRALMQNSLLKKANCGLNELYLVSLTARSLRPIVNIAGRRAVQILGDQVRAYPGDPRQKEVFLTPVLLNPNTAIVGLIEEFNESNSNSKKESLRTKIELLSDGLDLKLFSESDAEVIKRFADKN